MKSEDNCTFILFKLKIDSIPEVIQFTNNARHIVKVPTQLKYSGKLQISYKKAKDIYNIMKEHGSNMSNTDKEYWYPKPTLNNTLKFEKEKISTEIPNSNWLTQLTINDKELQEVITSMTTSADNC